MFAMNTIKYFCFKEAKTEDEGDRCSNLKGFKYSRPQNGLIKVGHLGKQTFIYLFQKDLKSFFTCGLRIKISDDCH